MGEQQLPRCANSSGFAKKNGPLVKLIESVSGVYIRSIRPPGDKLILAVLCTITSFVWSSIIQLGQFSQA